MAPSNRAIGIFWLLFNVLCAVWNFSIFAQNLTPLNLAIGALNTIVAVWLLDTLVRYWK